MTNLEIPAFHEVLHRIPFEDTAWDDLITLLKRAFGCQAGIVLITRDDDHDILVDHSPDFRLTDDVRSAFEASEWITAALPEAWSQDNLKLGVILGTDIVDQDVMRSTPFYRDVLSQLELDYLMAGVSLFGGSHRSLLKLFRGLGQDNFSAVEAMRLSALMPEIRQMMRFTERLHERIVVETAAARSGAPAGAATIVVDRDGKIVHANEQGERLLGEQRLLRSRNQRLAAVDGHDDRSIQHVLHRAVGGAEVAEQGCTLIGEDSQAGVRQVLVLPTPVEAPPFPWMEELQVAAVAVIDPVRDVSVSPAILKTMYGLTPAEIDLTNAMANGVKPVRFAARTGKAIATVQSQRQAVFSKIGVTNQLELMRILRDLVVSFERQPAFELRPARRSAV